MSRIVSSSNENSGSSAMRRLMMATIGVVLAGVAAIGVVLPGIPTVGPLILASFFLAKSNPALEKRLIRNRFFAKYLPYLDGSREMSIRAKWSSIGLMWTSILISCVVLKASGSGPWWLLSVLSVAGLVGTIFILRFGKQSTDQVDKEARPEDAPASKNASSTSKP